MKLRVGARSWMYISTVLAALLVVSIFFNFRLLSGTAASASMPTVAKEPTVASGAPKVDFYVMSYCPYGNQAEEGLAPVYNLLKGKVEFNPHYVVYSKYQGGGPTYCIDPESNYCSMHGAQEMRQDVREMCVDKYMGAGNWFKFALAMNSQCSAQNADSCWEKVATSLGLDAAKIKSCEASESITIAAEELSLDSQNGVQGSPTVFIGGKEYSGGRAPGDFLKAICAQFPNPPAECNTQLTASTASTATAAGCGT